MKEVYKILNEIKEAKGSKLKSSIFENSLKVPGFLEYIRLCFDEQIFGVGSKTFLNIMNCGKSKFEDAGEHFASLNIGPDEDEMSQKDFFEYVETARELSGSKLDEFLFDGLKYMSKETGKWFIRLVLKAPRLGLTVKSVNKVLVDNNISPIFKFGVQLAGSKVDLPSITEYYKQNPSVYRKLLVDALINYMGCGKTYTGIKMDGLRAVTEKVGTKVSITSRQGKDMSTYFPEIVDYVKNINLDFKIDGEIMADTFDDITKRNGCKVENQKPVPGLKYYVYDIMNLNGNVEIENQEQRNKILLEFFKPHESKLFEVEVLELLTAEEIANKLLIEVLVNDEEGLMIKDKNANYIVNDRNNWQKLKLFKENTWKIIGYEYGEGKNSNKIGSLKIRNRSGSITTNVGSGLTDRQRDYFTEIKESLNGMFCDVKYFEISKDSKTNQHSLRFPTFLKLRVDKTEADDVEVQK